MTTPFSNHLSPYSPPSRLPRLRLPCVFIHYPINTPQPLGFREGDLRFFCSSSVGYFGNKLSLCCKPWHLSVLPCWESLKTNLLAWAAPFLHKGSFLMLQTWRPNNSSQMSYLNTSSSALLFNPLNSHFHLLTCLLSGSPLSQCEFQAGRGRNCITSPVNASTVPDTQQTWIRALRKQNKWASVIDFSEAMGH